MKSIYPVTFGILLLTLVTLVLTGAGVPPWYAALIVAVTAMVVPLALLAVVMLFAGQHRRDLWAVFASTVRQDLAPFIALYRMLRKSR